MELGLCGLLQEKGRLKGDLAAVSHCRACAPESVESDPFPRPCS